jgi:galactose mutarotase-like enzyme
MGFRQTTVGGFPAVALRSRELEAVVVPALGAKISHLRRLAGREWLWRNPAIPFAAPDPSRSYVEAADSGGWDECFPTVGPSPIPGAGPDRPPLPDHGELWAAAWSGSVYERGGATTYLATALGRALPYELTRELTLPADEPLIRLRYHLRHTGDTPFPWIWSSHPLFIVQPGDEVELTGVSQVRVDAVHGRGDLQPDARVAWPGGLGSGTGDRLRLAGREGWAAKLFAEAGPSGRSALIDRVRGERLELRAAPGEVPHVGLWINCAGWAPNGIEPYYNVALEPCIGAPDRLVDAAERWHTAQTLTPGEERTWTLEVRLTGER